MKAVMIMVVTSLQMEPKCRVQMKHRDNMFQSTMLIAQMWIPLIGTVLQMSTHLEVHIAEIICQCLVMEVLQHPWIRGL
jgi:hypothetical protein